MFIFKRCILSAAAMTVSASAIAALPDPGLWAIDSEVNGKPGRGIQIDRQGGETVIASYFGYRADGTAVFYQAVGKITDGKTFKANLIEYKGGTVIGGAVKDATEAKTIGPMQAVFNTDSSGSVTLPGSESKAFSRYVYEDYRRRLNNEFLVSSFHGSSYLRPNPVVKMRIETSGDTLVIRMFNNSKYYPEDAIYTGNLKPDGNGFYSTGAVQPTGDMIATSAPVYLTFKNLTVSDKGILSASYFYGLTPNPIYEEGTLLGRCYAMPEEVFTGAMPVPCEPQHLGLTQQP